MGKVAVLALGGFLFFLLTPCYLTRAQRGVFLRPTKTKELIMYECYQNIIGISATDCECLEEGRPEDYDVSKSGLYLDELTNVKALLSVGECGKDFWQMLQASIALAVKRFVGDSNTMIGKKFQLRRQPLAAQVIGKIKAKDTVSPTKNYAVRRVACSPIRSGYFTLRGLGAIHTATGAMTVSVYNNVDGFLEDLDITTQANKHKKTSLDKEYPMFSKYTDCLEYYFVTEYDEANLPKDNEVSCGCGKNSFYFDLNTPYFAGHKKYGAAGWPDYVMVGSTSINSLTELDDLPAVSSNKMLGLTLELDFSCKVNEVLCGESLDFAGNPLALSLAFCILYMSGIEVANAVIKSPSLSPETLVNRTEWEESLEEWQQRYNEHINYIIPEINITANDCLTCADVLGMTRQGLFS